MSKKLDNKDNIEINHELERINDRVKNIEQIATTIESLADHGLKSWEKYLDQKNEREKREADVQVKLHEKEIEVEDRKHKRSIIVLFICIFIVFILLLTAMIIGQYDLVKVILGSSLAVAGGAGITSMLKRGKS